MAAMSLADRAAIRILADDGAAFLQGLLTADVTALAPGGSAPAALLTPQGKVLFDMVLSRCEQSFWIDCRAGDAEDLAGRLSFYRLRASVDIEPAPDIHIVWSPPGAPEPDGLTPDPRHRALGLRGLSLESPASDGSAAYHALRIAAGIAEAGIDYDRDTVFPHEANLDLLGGISFTKGCFIGQEVVSRMHHRGTARKRFLPCAVEGDLPAKGTPVTAGERTIGAVGSSAAASALALLRLDRLEAAHRARIPLMAADARLRPRIPGWAAGAAGDLARELA